MWGGGAALSVRTRLQGLCPPATEKDRASQAHVQSERRRSGLTLGGPGCGTGRIVRPCGLREPRWTLSPTHAALAWGPDLATPSVAWLGPGPSGGAAGDHPVGCRGPGAREAGVPRGLPEPQGPPLLAGTAAGPGGSKLPTLWEPLALSPTLPSRWRLPEGVHSKPSLPGSESRAPWVPELAGVPIPAKGLFASLGYCLCGVLEPGPVSHPLLFLLSRRHTYHVLCP